MIRIDRVRCELCGTCVGVCAADAIIIEGTFISIDRERCVECLSCVRICPLGAPAKVADEPSTAGRPS